MSKFIKRNLAIFIAALSISAVSFAGIFSKPDGEDHEARLNRSLLELSEEELKDQFVGDDLAELRLFCERYGSYLKDLRNYYDSLSKKLYEFKSEDQVEKILGCSKKITAEVAVGIVNTSLAAISYRIREQQAYGVDLLNDRLFPALLEEAIERRNDYLYGRLERSSIHGFVWTTPRAMLKYDEFNKAAAQQAIISFEFYNNMIKYLYKIVPAKSRQEYTDKYIDTCPVLKKFLTSDGFNHPDPDSSYEDLVTYGKEFYVTIAIYKNGKPQLESTHIKYKNEFCSKFIPEGHIGVLKNIEGTPRNKKRQLLKLVKNGLKNNEVGEQENDKAKVMLPNKAQLLEQERRIKIQERENNKKNLENSKLLNNIKIKIDNNSENRLVISGSTREKYEKIEIKEKIKKHGMANTGIDGSKSDGEDNIIEVKNDPLKTRNLHGKHWKLFVDFWSSKDGISYDNFVTLFVALGGIVEDKTKSTHMRLVFIDGQGKKHVGGVWQYHGGADSFGYNFTKYLKHYFTECGLTHEWVKYIEIEEKDDNKE